MNRKNENQAQKHKTHFSLAVKWWQNRQHVFVNMYQVAAAISLYHKTDLCLDKICNETRRSNGDEEKIVCVVSRRDRWLFSKI
jgi:hypothetical protein